MLKKVMNYSYRAICIFLMILLITPACFSFSAVEDMTAAQIVSEMTLRQKIGQMIMPAVRTWMGEDVTELNEELISAIKEFDFGGIILFGQNIAGTEQTVRLTDSMQKAAKDGGCIPLFISVDQEGGIITRFASGTSMPGNMALAATGSTEITEKAAAIIGKESRLLGINVDFAPDTDVNTNPSNPVIGVRSFSDDPKTVAKFALAYIRGLESSGVIAAVKHFPGHGDTDTDSHIGLPLVNKTYDQLIESDLLPFKTTIDNNVDWVMTAHIQYPLIEKDKYISIKDGAEIFIPATLSDAIISDVLRSRLGYDGIVSTDAMEMSAIAENFSIEDTAKLAINAGIDVLLMPITIDSVEGINKMRDYIQAIEDMVISGKIDENEINDSAKRIVDLKIRRNIINESTETVDERVNYAIEIVGSADHHAIERDITDKAITVTKNNDTLPLKTVDGDSVLLVATTQNELKSLIFGVNRLKAEGVIPKEVSFVALNYTDDADKEKINSAIDECKYVIIISKLYSEDELNPTSDEGKRIDEIIGAAHKIGKKAVVLSIRNPYDAARYTEADAFVVAYNSSTASFDDEGNPIGKYGPNIPAATDIIFGKVKPTGKLPIDIPTITESYSYSDKVFFTRGYGISSFTSDKNSPPTSEADNSIILILSIAAIMSAAFAVLFICKKVRSTSKR